MVVNKFSVGDEFNLNRQWVEGEKSIEISENFSRQFEFINLKSFKIRERGGEGKKKESKKVVKLLRSKLWNYYYTFINFAEYYNNANL